MSTCKYCGCTDAKACPGGCWWVNEEETICSSCLDKVSGAELVELAEAEVREAEMSLCRDFPALKRLVGFARAITDTSTLTRLDPPRRS